MLVVSERRLQLRLHASRMAKVSTIVSVGNVRKIGPATLGFLGEMPPASLKTDPCERRSACGGVNGPD